MNTPSTLFSSLRMHQAKVNRIEATAPWGLRATPSADARFILVLEGSLVLRAPDHSPPVTLSAGSLSIVFASSSYSLADHANSRLVDHERLDVTRQDGTVRFGGGGRRMSFLAGRFVLDPMEANHVLEALPEVLHLHLDGRRSYAFQSVLGLIATELEHPALASEEMIDSLCAALLIHALRSYIQGEVQNGRGWLAGLCDRQLARTLHAMHRAPAKRWDVEALAAEAGMSRSGFAARFTAVVGQSPMAYLARWRIHQATLWLRKTDLTIGQIAKRVGYASESAFTKVFQRTTGVPPSSLRAISHQNDQVGRTS